MDIFSLFTLCGGLAFFLFGMTVMSDHLKKVAGGRMQETLKKLTSNPLKSLALGAVITIAIQSSSALTVMLVGLVNSGIMQLEQTVCVIMGSDIGTTLTAWILSLNGIESDNFLISLLKPENFSPIVALIGVIMLMACKSQKKKDLGTIFCGFAVLMYGMTLMSDAVSPLADMPEFQQLLVAFENPFLGLLIGTLFTGVIQSSAAAIGVLQALALTGSIHYGMAIPIVMGANIGTCVTAILSCIGVDRKAKRVAVIHIGMKIIGAILWMAIYLIARYGIGLAFFDEPISAFAIAVFHSIFNIGTVLVLLPFQKQLVSLSQKILPITEREAREARTEIFLDERLLLTPPVAVNETRNQTVRMADLSAEAFSKAMNALLEFNEEELKDVVSIEERLDYYEDELNTYLLRLSGRTLSDKDTSEVSEMMHSVNDFERISDHAANTTEIIRRMQEDKLSFSKGARKEIQTLRSAVSEILRLMTESFRTENAVLAENIEPLKEVIENLIQDIKNRHIIRLQTGECSGEMGVVMTDLLTNFERVSAHCSNVGVCVIQSMSSSYEAHSYVEELKDGNEPEFYNAYERYTEEFRLDPFKPKKKKNKDAEKKERKAQEGTPRKEKEKKGQENSARKEKEKKAGGTSGHKEKEKKSQGSGAKKDKDKKEQIRKRK